MISEKNGVIPESDDSLVVHVDDSLQISDCDLTAVKINAIPKRSDSLLALVNYSLSPTPKCDSIAVKTNAIPKRSDSLLTLVDYSLSLIPECHSTASRIDVIPESNDSLEMPVTENMDDSAASKTDVISKCRDSSVDPISPKINEILETSDSPVVLVDDSLLVIPDCYSAASKSDMIPENNDSRLTIVREIMDDSLSLISDSDSIALKSSATSKHGDSPVALVAAEISEISESNDSPMILVDDSLLPILDCDSTASSIDLIPESNDSPVTDDSLSPIPDCDSTGLNYDVISKCSDSSVALVAPKINELPESSDSPVTLVDCDSTALVKKSIDSVSSQIAKPKKGQARRVFDETGSPRSRKKVLSRYLTDSHSSCHDICKYGGTEGSKTKTEMQHVMLKQNIKAQGNEQIKEKTTNLSEMNGKPTTSHMRSDLKSRKMDVLDASKAKVLASTNKESVSKQLSARPERNYDIHHKVIPTSLSLRSKGHSGKTEDEFKAEITKATMKGDNRVLEGTIVMSSQRPNAKPSLHIKRHARKEEEEEEEEFEGKVMNSDKSVSVGTTVMLPPRSNVKPVLSKSFSRHLKGHSGKEEEEEEEVEGKVMNSDKRLLTVTTVMLPPRPNVKPIMSKSRSVHIKGHSSREEEEEEVEGKVMNGDKRVLAGTTVMLPLRPSVKPVMSKSLSLHIKRHSSREEEDDEVQWKVINGDKRVLPGTTITLPPRPNVKPMLLKSLSAHMKGHSSGEEEEVKGKVMNSDKRVSTSTTVMLPPRPNVKPELSKSLSPSSKGYSDRAEVEEEVMKGDKRVLVDTTVLSSRKPNIKRVLSKPFFLGTKRYSRRKEDNKVERKVMKTSMKDGKKVLAGATAMSSPRPSIKQVVLKSLSFRFKKYSGKKEDDEVEGKEMKGDKKVLAGAPIRSSPRLSIKQMLSKSLSFRSKKHSDRKKDEVEGKVMKASMKGDKSALTSATVTSSPRSNLKKSKELKLSHGVSRDGRKTGAEDTNSAEVPEKVLQVVEPENKNKILPGTKNPLSGSPSSSSYSKNRTVTKKLGINRSKDKQPSSNMLKFRMVRTLALEPDEVPALKRLKFKRRLPRENIPVGKTGIDKPSSSKTVEFSKGLAIAGNDETLNEKVKVTLRHQDSQKKEVNSSLGNEVIEETASKLERVRSSKVKALVGAFESLIVKDDSSSQVSAS